MFGPKTMIVGVDRLLVERERPHQRERRRVAALRSERVDLVLQVADRVDL
jgi:predicted regulator of Ras-like GTPase activity (Roadblock/LC7/MglB family)